MPSDKWLLVAGIVTVALLLEAAIFVFVMPRGVHDGVHDFVTGVPTAAVEH